MKKFEIIAKTLFGFEELLAGELRQIGAEDIEILNRAVKYSGDKSILYLSNLYLRTALKILKPIGYFDVANENDLYNKVKEISWENHLSADQSLAIDGFTNSKFFNHSQYVALKTKDAIADYFREKYGKRPSVDLEYPDLRINVHITDMRCTLSLDSSGPSLGKRGYKKNQTEAPLSEVLAAGIIMLTLWDKETAFYDPMCGSGTFAVEAALIAGNIAPGLFRNFAFQKWKDYEPELWKSILEEAKAKVQKIKSPIIASDSNPRAVSIARANAAIAGVDKHISFDTVNFHKSLRPFDNGIMVMNPPYGKRLEDEEKMTAFYKMTGDYLKNQYQGWDAWIFSGNPEALKHFGLRASKKSKLFNGQIECSLQKFELYQGSKKAKKNQLGYE